jgi:hypothetical protein
MQRLIDALDHGGERVASVDPPTPMGQLQDCNYRYLLLVLVQ